MSAKKKGAGGNLTRTQIVTVRLDPKLRYLAELAALKQRRTLSSYIEWAIQDSLSRVYLREGSGYDDPGISVQDEADRLWDVDEPDRFAELALRYPELLTHDDQIKWKLIRENGYLWRGKMVGDVWKWVVDKDNLVLERLRQHWEHFCAVAAGDTEASILPKWNGSTKIDAVPKPKPSDDVPF